MTGTPPRPSRRAVLVVDDDDRIRAVVRAVLEAGDFNVAEAVDGPSALQLLASSDDSADGDAGVGQERVAPDVLVLDVMMPGMDGIEVCRQVDHRTTRVLMLTAREDVAIRDASAAAGADAFLAKPFSAVELLNAIERLSADTPGA